MNEDGHVLKSRRGLLAAGLSAAVVGAMGVASTVNAGAAEIPAGSDAAPSASTVVHRLTPPARLPSGALPKPAKIGEPGMSSETLRKKGLDAAPPDPRRVTRPQDAVAPGQFVAGSSLASEQAGVSPPAGTQATLTRAGAVTSTATTVAPPALTGDDSGKFFFHSGVQQDLGVTGAAADGAGAQIAIWKPAVANGDLTAKNDHTLAELAVQSADRQQAIEVGWTVDRSLSGGDVDPHLFVFYWVNGQEADCYNECGFVPILPEPDPKVVAPGATLPSGGVQKKFTIMHKQDDHVWWITYDEAYLGYFPDTIWSAQGVTFTKVGFVQAFGEVAASNQAPCIDMGNGITPDKASGALIGSLTYFNGPSPNPVVIDGSNKGGYAVYQPPKPEPPKPPPAWFRYGGPGAC